MPDCLDLQFPNMDPIDQLRTKVQIHLSDATLFGNEAAEDEPESIFSSYALERGEVNRFLDHQRPIAVVRAYKGEGKSALLRMVGLSLRARANEAILINTTASAISPEVQGTESDTWVRAWKESLLRLAVREIGARISVAFSDDTISLVEEAESNGFRSRSFVSTVVDRLKSSAIPVEKARVGVVNPAETLKRWRANGSPIWFVIDDIDQNFENNAYYHAKIASVFTAARQIVNLIPEFRFRLAIRPNVWALVKQKFEALAHVEQYMEDLLWTIDDSAALLSRRIEGFLQRTNQHARITNILSRDTSKRQSQLIALVFQERMPWGLDGERSPISILYTLSRHRPRWLIELCKAASKSADLERLSTIMFSHIDKNLVAFGRRRIDDTIAEFRSQCPNIGELLTAFADQPEWFSTGALMSAIDNRILRTVTPVIAGYASRPLNRDVAHFLYQIGFLTARRDRPDGSYVHIAYAENPDLLQQRTNLDQGYSWEIHPVFRQVLRLKNVKDRR